MRNEIVQASISPDVSFSCKPLEYGISQIKFVILFLVIVLLNNFQNLVFAQNGDNCHTAISIPLQEGYSVSQQSYLKWYSFYANDSIATFSIGSEANLLPDSMIIYVGNCDSLIQYGAYLIDTERVKLVNVPINQSFCVCFISTARNCNSCLISPLSYYFTIVSGDIKSIQSNTCINPVPNCEYICNGSFEFKSSCPTQSSQLTNANSWINVLQTPEYFNSCQGNCTNTLASTQVGTSIFPTCINIPNNFAGSQLASPNINGTSGYAGIIAAGGNATGNITYAEYIGQQLNQPLQVGVAYNFSMDISWAEVSRLKAKNFGVYFSSGSANFGTFISNQPQILFPSFITNSNGWTTLTGTFTPSAPGLNKFYFGLFPNALGAGGVASSVTWADPANQTSLPNGLDASRWAYYYVDNFSLKVAETEKHFEVNICPSPILANINQFSTALLNIPNQFTNITWDIISGLTISSFIPGSQPYSATYNGSPTTITAHAYIGNCPIDLFFHVTVKDLCECDAFNCYPGSPPPPGQINSYSTVNCFSEFNLNTFMSMTGVYNFSYNLSYDNCTIKMGPNSSFIVSNGATLTFNNSTLFACSTMWTGIVVEAGGTLIINNSRIEDALKAIEVQPGATVIVDGCVFNKNWIGVSIESGAGSAEFTGQKMTFTCTSDDSPTNGALLLAPHSGEHGFAGIYANESPYLSIGNIALVGNLFTEIQFGIYAEKSSLEVVNCDFTKLFYNSAEANSNSGIYTMECDLVVGGINTSNLNNHFSKLKFGIISSYNNTLPLTPHILLIRNNEFENYNSPNTPFYRCISISGGYFPDFEISNNRFESFNTGISMFGDNAHGEIKYNILDGYSFASTTMYISSAAISISNPLYSNISIFENKINANQDHSCNTGINLLSTASNFIFKADVIQNTIYKCRIGINCIGFKNKMLTIKDHDPNLGAGIYLEQKGFIQKGIQLSSCVRAKVTNNYVKALSGSAIPNSNIENKVFGIYVNGSCLYTSISENYFWRLGTGMYFSGGYTNLPLTVNCNRMIQNVNGVNITNTDIGNQGFAAAPAYNGAAQDNQWNIPNGTAYMGAKVNIPQGQPYPTWYSRSASLPFLPNAIFKMFPPACIVANNNFLVPNSAYNCSFGCPNPPCQHFRIYEMANNESPYDQMSEEELGNLKLSLLYQLKNDSLLLDSLLNVGGIITNYINNLLVSEENELANSARLLSERDTIGGLAALGGVNANTDPRANQVIVNEIFARTWARGLEVTESQDSLALMQIACTEPQYGGLAVFDAMAMINWDTCGYYNYNNDRRGNFSTWTNSTSENELSKSFKIYPNPTKSNIKIEFYDNLKINSILVCDVSGRQISCSFSVLNNQVLLETINLAKGFYIAKFVDNQKNSYGVSFVKE